MTTVEIPLDPTTARGLRRCDQRLGLIALAALQSCQGRDEREHDPVAPPEPESPVEARTGVALPRPAEAGDLGSADAPDATIEPPTPSFEPARPDAGHIAATYAAPEMSVASDAVSAGEPPPTRGGDVYIAHYYARLPGDANRNPYTRLGGPAAHA
jgi:hypothetical protein